tara:strand:- start:19 stop:939 length:921 start_codon:yes stop_codon:yes gene_type:complete
MQTTILSSLARSGLSWTSKILSFADGVLARDEQVLSRSSLILNKYKWEKFYWNLYVNSENEDNYIKYFQNEIKNDFTFTGISDVKDIKDLNFLLRRKGRCIWRKIKNFNHQIIADRALLSMEWLHQKFDANIVIIIRHPASYVGSCIRQGYFFDFEREIMDQKNLVNNLFKEYLDEINGVIIGKNDILSQHSLLWKIMYSLVAEYEKKYDNWTIIRLEDINKNPLGEFEKLYNKLGLEFTEFCRQKVIEYSTDSKTETPSNGIDDDKRNSKEMIKAWQKLPTKDVSKIRSIVDPVSIRWYGNSDWR